MLSLGKLRIAAAVGVPLLLAACGGSSQSTPSPKAARSSTTADHSASHSGGGVRIGTASGPAGTYLVGASGRALYLWVADSKGRSSCSGACAQVWPPLTATSAPQVMGGAQAADVSLISRPDGTKQVAYNGHPLYYYVADRGSGVTRGQGSNSFGAKWWLVTPSGQQITSGG